MNPESVFLAAVGVCCSACSVFVFCRSGYIPLLTWFFSLSERDAALYQSWVDELSLGWNPERAHHAARLAHIVVIAAAATVFILTRSPVFAGGVAVIAYWLPRVVYRAAREARLQKLAKQIPDAIGVMAASVGAGKVLESAIEDVHKRMPNPISHEFALILNESRVRGLSIEDALGRARARIPIESFTMVASALIINMRQGGDLRHILERISEATHELFRLQKKLESETAEVRAQEKVIILLTPLFLVMVLFFDPSIPDILFNSFTGNLLLMVVAVIQLIGFLWIRRIVRAII